MFPDEIFLKIFKTLFNELEQTLCMSDELHSSGTMLLLKNLRLVSRGMNSLVLITIRDVYDLLKRYPNLNFHIWKNIVFVFLIHVNVIESECAVERIRCKSKNYNVAVTMLEYIGLDKEFILRCDSLRFGKLVYRRTMMKDHDLDDGDISNGGLYQMRKFKRFYQRYLQKYYRYRCRKTDRVGKLPFDIETYVRYER